MIDRNGPQEIRNHVTGNAAWDAWLARFPNPPGTADWSFDLFSSRIGPFLRNRPEPALLDPIQRLTLAGLFKDYARLLLVQQKRANVGSVVNIGSTGVSLFGWILGIAACEPISLGLSIYTLGYEGVENRRWKSRREMLVYFSQWIAELL